MKGTLQKKVGSDVAPDVCIERLQVLRADRVHPPELSESMELLKDSGLLEMHRGVVNDHQCTAKLNLAQELCI
jgi:hypothetical protein